MIIRVNKSAYFCLDSPAPKNSINLGTIEEWGGGGSAWSPEDQKQMAESEFSDS